MASPTPKLLTDEDVLELLRKSRTPLSLRDIAATAGLRHAGRRILSKIMTHLKRRGRVEEVRGGRYQLAEGRPAAHTAAQSKRGRREAAQKSKAAPAPGAQAAVQIPARAP